MLTISRRKGESFFIGNEVQVVISDISRNQVKVSIGAPPDVKVLREELVEVRRGNTEATQYKDYGP